GIGSDFNERLSKGLDFFSGQGANHTRNCFGCRDIEVGDLRVCVRRADEAQIKHLAQLDVIGKLTAPAQQTVFFFAGQRPSNPIFLVSLGTHALTPQLDFYCKAACRPSISFCTFFFPSGSSKPPATEVSRPKT